jgi:hypothetical protein
MKVRRVLDQERIREFRKNGWSNKQIAAYFDLPVNSISRGMWVDQQWEADPTLRARWEARLPAMKTAISAEVGR